jgi:hypothetical protein
MSLIHSRLLFRKFVFISTLTALSRLAPAATLTISPSSTSNTFAGPLTLQITGLTNGQVVIVEKYLDLNGDSTVQANEPLVDTFSIAESGASIIGGITNLNVPFDSNSATDKITTTMSFVPSLENITAQTIFRLISPTGAFPPQTAIFTITNAALNQSVNGTVYNNATPLPNALVAVLTAQNQNYVTSIATDSSSPGHYHVNLNPDTYFLIPVLQDYVTDQSLAPMVTLTNGMSVTNNLFLTNGTVTISGRVYDASNSNGVGGVFMQFQSGNLFGMTFTDTNGNYSAAVLPGTWKVKTDSDRMASRGLVVPNDPPKVDTTTGSVASVDFALPPANAIFYGRIADGSNAPLPNISVHAEDGGQFSADGTSDANGNYTVAVFANGPMWDCFPDSGKTPAIANRVVSFGLGQTNILPGQAVLQNFTALAATASISGKLQDNSGNPVGNLNINAMAVIGGTQYEVFANSDGSGNYSLPAVNGNWMVTANCCGNQGLDNYNLTDFFQSHPVVIPPTNAVLNLTFYPIGTAFLTQVSRVGSSFGFNLFGAQGNSYTVEATTNLALGHWFTVASVTNLSSNSQFIWDGNATNGTRIYRARLGL